MDQKRVERALAIVEAKALLRKTAREQVQLERVQKMDLSYGPRQEVEHRLEVVELKARCAVYERPYLMQLERRGNLLTYARGIRGEAARTGGGTRSAMVRVATSNIDWNSISCAWCGANGLAECGGCKELVCMGRSRPGWFNCPCGGSGPIVLKLREVNIEIWER